MHGGKSTGPPAGSQNGLKHGIYAGGYSKEEESMKGRILVVEDEVDILDMVSYNLEKAGYQVQIAVDGEAALTQIREKLPDLIVLDLMLPGMDGLRCAGF